MSNKFKEDWCGCQNMRVVFCPILSLLIRIIIPFGLSYCQKLPGAHLGNILSDFRQRHSWGNFNFKGGNNDLIIEAGNPTFSQVTRSHVEQSRKERCVDLLIHITTFSYQMIFTLHASSVDNDSPRNDSTV